MHRLKKVVEYIWDETMGAEQYAMCALNNKDEDRTLAEAYYNMANQEMSHAETLISNAERIVSQHRGEEGVEHIWEWEHDKIMKFVSKAKYLIEMFRK